MKRSKPGTKSFRRSCETARSSWGSLWQEPLTYLHPTSSSWGGGLVEAMPRLYIDEVAKSLAKHVMPSYQKTYELKAAKLGDDAGAMGAAAWARRLIEA